MNRMTRKHWAFVGVMLLIATVAYAGVVVHGQLIDAALENLNADPTSHTGRVYYNTVSNQPKVYNGTAWTSLGGSGNGEKNYVANGTSSATGWTASGAGVTCTTVTTGLPDTSVGTGLAVTGVSGSTAYCYNAFQIDTADYNKKMKLAFDMAPVSGYVASDFLVSVNSCTQAWASGTCGGTSARLALSTDSSAVSALPNLTGTFRTTWDSPGSSAPYIQVQIGLNGTNTHQANFAQIVAGPGVVTQGAAVTGGTSFTPSFVSSSLGTLAASTAYWWRVGDSMRVYGSVTAGTVTSSNLELTLPTGTVDTTHASGTIVGRWVHNNAAATSRKGGPIFVIGNASNQFVYFGTDDYTSGTAALVAVAASGLMSSSEVLSFEFTVKIAEWAGSGTVNVSQNDVEYLSNSDTSSTASVTASGYQYGPSGQTFGSNWSSLGTQYNRRVATLTPISSTDEVVFQTSEDSCVSWGDIAVAYGNVCSPFLVQGASQYGVQLRKVDATHVDVEFQAQGRYANNASYAGNGPAWSGLTGGSFCWRVVKRKAGQAIGFGNVIPGTAAGLVSATGLAGNAVSTYVANSYPVGYVGEYLERNSNVNTSITSGTIADVDSTGITLTAGTWDITASVQLTPTGSTSITRIQSWIGTATGNVTTGQDLTRNYIEFATAANVLGNVYAASLPVWRVSISSSTPYYCKVASTFTASTLTGNCNLRATRVL